nr:ribonuclease H-like domain-containing protein [Tanacetum cinerariifolium]
MSKSKVPSPGADETTFPTGDARYGEAFLLSLALMQGKTGKTLLKPLPFPVKHYQRQHSLMEERVQSQDLEITQLKTRVKTLEDNKMRREGFTQEDAPNIGGMNQREDLLVGDTVKDSDKSADKGSDSTYDMANVLGTLGAENILASRGLRSVFTIDSLSVATTSTVVSPAVAIASRSFSIAVIFATASVATPTTRVTRSSRGVVIESSSPISDSTGNTGYKVRDNGKRHAKHDEHKAMVTIDGEGVDWTGHAKDEAEDYALMAFNSSNSGSDTKGTTWSSDVEDSHVNERFAKFEGMQAVLPPMTGNYMPHKSSFGIDESKFTYGPKQSTTSESNAKTSDLDSYESSSSVETLETTPKPVESKPKVVNEPKIWTDAPIIEEYESVSDDEHVTIPSKEQEKPSFAFVNTVKHVKTPRKTAKEHNTFSNVRGKWKTAVKASTGCNWRYKRHYWSRVSKYNSGSKSIECVDIKDPLGRLMHRIGNKAYLVDYQDFNGGPVAFGGSRGHITGKGKIKTRKLDFEDVYFVKELHHFNLFSVSQICDKKNKVLFTDTECLVLSPEFKLPDENQVLLRVPRQHNMYSFNLENWYGFN